VLFGVLPSGVSAMRMSAEPLIVRSSLVVAGFSAAFLLFACGSGAGIEGPFQVTTVTVPSSNAPPTVDAGPDQNVNAGDNVTLIGNAWDDYWVNRTEWQQKSGPAVWFSGGPVLRPSFVAPWVSEPTELRFLLRAFDNSGQVGSDETSVFVEPVEGLPPDVPAATYSLNFESLPSSQGWTYHDDSLAESNAYSVDGAHLKQTTVSSGTDSIARYQMDNVVSRSMPMTLSVTARILDYENLTGGSTGLGFNFLIRDGALSHRLALTADLIQVGGQFYGLNTTDFHDYRFELHPGGGFDLYVDGVIFTTGNGLEFMSDNSIFFGDSTAHENSDAEITAMSFNVGTN
jgi:hypothetical protein